MSSYFQAVQSIQETLGKEKAEPVLKALDAVFQALEEKAKEKEIRIKIEVAEEVKKNLKEEKFKRGTQGRTGHEVRFIGCTERTEGRDSAGAK